MIRNTSIPVALVVLGVALLLTPAVVPAQQLLYHDTGPGVAGGPEQLEHRDFTVISYGNLSDRGKELYRETLRRGGEYAVPVGEGAPEFDYAGTSGYHGVVIERPADDEFLPPADEPVERGAHVRDEPRDDGEDGTERANRTATGPTVEERRQQIGRYDLVSLRVDTPPLTATSNLSRLLSALVGVVLIGVGGYLAARP